LPYQIVWSDSALERIAEFLDFIGEEDRATARRMLEGLRDQVRALADFPRLGRPLAHDVDPGLRRLVVGISCSSTESMRCLRRL
jgi:plasmid stabilization system protein ParE